MVVKTPHVRHDLRRARRGGDEEKHDAPRREEEMEDSNAPRGRNGVQF